MNMSYSFTGNLTSNELMPQFTLLLAEAEPRLKLAQTTPPLRKHYL